MAKMRYENNPKLRCQSVNRIFGLKIQQKQPPGEGRHADRPSPGSQILHLSSQEDDHDKRQPSPSLSSGGTIHFL